MFGLGACCCLVGGFDNCFCCMVRWVVGGLVKGMLAVLWFGFVSWVLDLLFLGWVFDLFASFRWQLVVVIDFWWGLLVLPSFRFAWLVC